MVKWFDLQTDFYKPLWLRVAIVVVCFGWAIIEFFKGGGLWAAFFAFLGAVAFQQFFLDGWPASETNTNSTDNAHANSEVSDTSNTPSDKSKP